MNTSRWVLVAVAVAGLLAVRLAHGAEETGIILKQPLEPELGQAEECLSTRHVRNFEILNDKLVILKGTHHPCSPRPTRLYCPPSHTGAASASEPHAISRCVRPKQQTA